MHLVHWFEIPVSNIERAKAFYQGLLNIKITDHIMGPNKMGWFPMEENGTGATGSLIQGEAYNPSMEGVTIYFTVVNIDQTLAKVNTLGGEIIYEKTDLGDHGYIAHVKDTEGNKIALHMKKINS